jgi:HSP20 family protein
MPSLIKYKPYSLLQSVEEEMSKVLHSAFRDFSTDSTENIKRFPVDIKETDTSYVVTADLAGVKPEDIKVSIDNNILTIQGEKIIENRETNKNYQILERYSGNFYRQFSLPSNIDGENIKAKSKNGVLELLLPKTKVSTTRYIEVKGNN